AGESTVAADRAGARRSAVREARAAAAKQPAAAAPLRVLIADDYRLFAESLAGSLRMSEEIDVVAVAHDGEQAVDLARRLVPDVALLDLRMPVTSGVEATERICALGTPTTVAVMSALDDDDELVGAALAAGATVF